MKKMREKPRKKQEEYAMTDLKNPLLPPVGRIDAVLDTDTYNEIDDQFALSFMMKTPEKFCMKAIYSAPFLMEILPLPRTEWKKATTKF